MIRLPPDDPSELPAYRAAIKLDDETFVPCRDDRCMNEELHAAHDVPMRRGRQIRRCPVCNSKIVRVPRKWACCSKCPWRINNKQSEDSRA